jgi:hypothetical protein
MGEEYPQAEVIGTDIAKIQPSAVPPNVFFEIDDAEEESGWTYPDDNFDLVHFRSMKGAFRDVRRNHFLNPPSRSHLSLFFDRLFPHFSTLLRSLATHSPFVFGIKPIGLLPSNSVEPDIQRDIPTSETWRLDRGNRFRRQPSHVVLLTSRRCRKFLASRRR